MSRFPYHFTFSQFSISSWPTTLCTISVLEIAQEEGIPFVEGKGKSKPEIQKLHGEIEACGERLLKYQDHFEIMGSDRNSYSKTDLAATFMRMKDDHMLNGQLKPGYNVL